MSLILFIFGVIGMTNIIVESTLFAPFRDKLEKTHPKLHQLVTCHQCSGFWSGLVCGSLILADNFAVVLDKLFTAYQELGGWGVVACCGSILTSNLGLIFVAGCAGSFLATFYMLLNTYIESKIEYTVPEERNGD